jgi:hypothetical protein
MHLNHNPDFTRKDEASLLFFLPCNLKRVAILLVLEWFFVSTNQYDIRRPKI